MANLLSFLASIPRPIVALAIFFVYGTLARWSFRAPMLLDIALIGLYLWRPSIGLLAWVLLLLLIRHVRTLARDVAQLMRLAEFDGWTLRAVLFALPALSADVSIMSREEQPQEQPPAPAIYVPVSSMAYQPPPQPGDSPDIDAQISDMRQIARDITDEQALILLCHRRTKDGKPRYSANRIYELVGGDRNAVLARIKAIRDDAPPPQFRQEDGTTAPAQYPVSKSA